MILDLHVGAKVVLLDGSLMHGVSYTVTGHADDGTPILSGGTGVDAAAMFAAADPDHATFLRAYLAAAREEAADV